MVRVILQTVSKNQVNGKAQLFQRVLAVCDTFEDATLVSNAVNKTFNIGTAYVEDGSLRALEAPGGQEGR